MVGADKFDIYINTAQAQAALAQLRTTNSVTTAAMGAQWGIAKAGLMAGAAGIGLAAVAAGGAMMAVGEFNKSMALSSALGNLTSDEYNALQTEIKRVALAYGASSQEIAAGSVELVKAGVAGQDLIGSMDAITKLSVANQEEWANMAEIAVYSVNSYQRAWGELPLLLDEIQMAAQRGVIDVGEFQSMMAYAAQSGYIAGTSFESLLAAMTTLSNAGLEAGISARGLNQMIIGLIENRDEIQDWADTLGLGIQVVKDGAIDIGAFVEGLQKAGPLGVDMVNRLSEWFTVRGARVFASLASSSQSYAQNLAAITGAQGTLNRTMEDFSSKSMAVTMAKIKEQFVQIFYSDDMQNALRGILETISANMPLITEALSSLVNEGMAFLIANLPQMIDMFIQFMGILVEIAPYLMIFADVLIDIGPQLLTIFVILKAMKMLGIGEMLTTMAMQSMAFTQATITTAQALEIQKTALVNVGRSLMNVVMMSALMITSDNKYIQAAGAIMITIQAMIMLYQMLAYAKAAAAVGGRAGMMGNIAGMVAVGGAGTGAALGMSAAVPIIGGLAVAGLSAYMLYQMQKDAKKTSSGAGKYAIPASVSSSVVPTANGYSGGGTTYNYNGNLIMDGKSVETYNRTSNQYNSDSNSEYPGLLY